VANGTHDVAAATPVRTRKVIHATCTRHGGCRRFTSIVMTKVKGPIVFRHHDVGACEFEFEFEFDENAATPVRDTITEWLG
jgi:hypothetical protein